MRLRYWELVGKKIISLDGKEVGRIGDLIAARQGNELRVVALRVGTGAFIQRIGFREMLGKETFVVEIPWQYIARIEKQVHLKVEREFLVAQAKERFEQTKHREAERKQE